MIEQETFQNGLGRAGLMRVLAGMLLCGILAGYFIAYGPLDRQGAVYPPAGGSIDLDNLATAPQPDTP